MILMSYIVIRVTTINFWQARPTQCRPQQRWHTAALYSANYMQGLGLGGLASRGDPGHNYVNDQSEIFDLDFRFRY